MTLKFFSSTPVGTVKFEPGNGIRYLQDFFFYRGIPAGEYQVFKLGEGAFKLVAPGYGELGGDYGNGALIVSSDDWDSTTMSSFPNADNNSHYG